MQPLTLRVEGLHSFRNRVEVDLAELGQHGLFGIFGPTGSGKSTLLDALTLALYGQVDRLSGRSRRGIINHHAKRCEVRLGFRCGNTEWEVQRAYKKDKDGVAQRIHSRLLEHGALGPEVVADKEREVNARIEGLLGLNAQDFMRAVVLPQGRFMQFLHLQGSERRRMLQRLFRLEAYGEELRAKVKKESRSVDHALQHVLGELAGLGPAGAEDLEQSRSQATDAQASSTAALQQFQAAEATWSQAQRRREHGQALERATGTLATHLEQQDAMQQAKVAIRRARRARPVLSALERQAGANKLDQQSRATSTALNTELEQIRATEREASEAWQRAAEARSAEEPALERSREALTRAVALETRLGEQNLELRGIERTRTQGARRLEKEERALIALQAQVHQAQQEHSQLLEQIEAQAVPQALREQVFGAWEHKRTLENARQRGAELKAALQHTVEQLLEANQTEERSRAAVEQGEGRRQRASAWAAHLEQVLDALQPISAAAGLVRERGLVPRIDEANRRLERAKIQRIAAQAEVDTARDAQQQIPIEHLEQQIAGVLARTLDGPCPVCGSPEHPDPARPVEHQEFLQLVEQRAAHQTRLEVTSAALTHAIAETMACARALQTLTEQIPPTIDDPAAFLEREQQARRTVERAQDRTRRSIRALEKELEQANQLLAAAMAQRGALQDRRKQQQTELDQAVQTEGAAWGQLQEMLGELTLFDVPRLLKQIQHKDRERERLMPLLTQAEADVKKVLAKLETRKQRVASEQAALERLRLDHLRLSAERTKTLAELRLILPEGSAGKALEATLARLQVLADAVHARHQAREQTRQALLLITDRRASAEGRALAAATALLQAQADTEALLKEQGFQVAPTAAMGMLGQDLDQLEIDVQRWHARHGALQLTVDALQKNPLPMIDQAAFEAARSAWDQSRTAARELEQISARAQERLAQLEARSTRFDELKRAQHKLEQRAGRLDQLTRLLRGDRFVEYVANDHLHDLVRNATEHLGLLTRGRYALDLDDNGGFLIADLDAGGALRPAHSLSGGETFLTSLALALALSTQVQRHNAQALEFFFLDEGFGSLDPDALDRVMTALERLGSEHRVIGLISHIDAVKERVPRYLELRNPRDASGTEVAYREV